MQAATKRLQRVPAAVFERLVFPNPIAAAAAAAAAARNAGASPAAAAAAAAAAVGAVAAAAGGGVFEEGDVVVQNGVPVVTPEAGAA
ncbi:MAG: hypothetical protein ACPIOQ_22705, partial [Promethearchaeia archaeon]